MTMLFRARMRARPAGTCAGRDIAACGDVFLMMMMMCRATRNFGEPAL